MSSIFRRLPRLPRANGTAPGPVRPDTWNALVAYIEELEARIARLVPQASDSIGVRFSQSGFSLWNRRRARGGGSSPLYPFQISDASNEEDGCRVTVRKGLVESAYGLGPYPSNLWPDPDAPLYLAVTADEMWVRLVSTITGGEEPGIDSMVLDITDTLEADDDTVAYLIIGKVTSEVVEGTRTITGIFQNVRSNLLHGLQFEGWSFPDYWRQIIGPVSPSL